MPSLTPAELQEARRRSGKLGGRPPRPSREEARAAALEELVPPAIKSLRAHLDDGDPNAWRAALRVFEHAFGRPQEQGTATEDLTLPTNAWDAKNLSWTQLQMMAARVLGELPAGETEIGTNNAASVVVTDGTVA
jgi:hypothetical protein